MKKISSLFLIGIAGLNFNCSKSSPAPIKTNLQLLQAAMEGTWYFQTFTIKEISTGKSATTATCAQTELLNAGFAGTSWYYGIPEYKFVFLPKNPIELANICNSPTDYSFISVSATQNKDGTVTMATSNFVDFIVNVSDIKPTSIKGTFVQQGFNPDYFVTMTFTRM